MRDFYHLKWVKKGRADTLQMLRERRQHYSLWSDAEKTKDRLSVNYCDATDVDSFEKDIMDFFKMLFKLIESFIKAMTASKV